MASATNNLMINPKSLFLADIAPVSYTHLVALLLAIFALQDSFGTACNVTGDGALAMMMEGIFNRNRQLDDRFGTGE